MQTEKIGDCVVKLYQGIDETPITNDVLSNKYALIDNQIGSGVSKIREHLLRAAKFNTHGDKKAVHTQLDNLSKCISLTEQEVNPEHLSFAALIESINGAKVYDYSEENLKKITSKLGAQRLTSGRLSRILSGIKKKTKLR